MKRVLLWALGIIGVLIIAVVLAFRFSPWPSVALIQYAFSKGDKASEDILAKYVPPGIAEQLDLPYGDGPDERLDVFHRADAAGPQPTVVWIHGGGFVSGRKEAVAGYLKVLADRGYTVVNVEYSTGYGSVYPKPIEQVNRALAYVVAHAPELRVDPERIVLAGDSAGAQIAAQTTLLITDPDYARRMALAPGLDASRLRAVILVSGAFDFESADKDSWFINTVLWAYSGVRDFANDPRFLLASIPQHVSASFPPAFISSGNGDPLKPHAVTLVAALQREGVTVDQLFFPDDYQPTLPHEYQFNLDLDAAREAFERIVAFLAAHTG